VDLGPERERERAGGFGARQRQVDLGSDMDRQTGGFRVIYGQTDRPGGFRVRYRQIGGFETDPQRYVQLISLSIFNM
jgi:hypothetical protein